MNAKRYINSNTRQVFAPVFQHLYQQWLMHLDEWVGLQNELAQARRLQLAEDLSALFIQPNIVEFIVKQLTQTLGVDVPSVIVLPQGVTPPAALLHIHCISAEYDSFAVKEGEHIVRFPQDLLCRQWLADIETQDGISALQQHINTLPSSRVDTLRQSMTDFVQHLFTPESEEES
uniref:OrfB n=1 Tax=Sodalis glossinidius TaxID=63612 RepID=Q6R8E5_SODGL|nr:orfB [Sodalis glossinidius]